MTSTGNAFSAASFAASAAAAGGWVLDPARTRIGLHSKSMWGMVKVNGEFSSVRGSGQVAPDGSVAGEVTIDASSVDTKNKKRDEHLRSKDFFDVANFPTITYTVEGISPLDGNQVTVLGTLTARGHSEALPLTATVTEATADEVTIEGEVHVDRSRFGMMWSPLKVATMDNRITVTANFRRDAS
ncbi:polyisoprenoid-binding protein YceI [Streptacidiphilus sp. MAP12-16]|uniref:YceI family protein n=1 Tax=Streptacidiphilus sp. MAP12-16 TaxID=3156300 RepID=UPI003513CC31